MNVKHWIQNEKSGLVNSYMMILHSCGSLYRFFFKIQAKIVYCWEENSKTPSYLCLVCFQENKFLEFIFLIFPCLVTIWKSSQRKLNSGQHKKVTLSKESVFLLIRKGKHFSFFHYTYFHKSRSLSFQKRLEAGTIEAFLWAIEAFLLNNWFQVFFSLYYFLYVFIFFV